ncbi:MAG: hypothetical protein IT383_26605 [Deltaproteobacteria bacterium]|nr:hypothetical protein [Deltaproteobacteria bacterium]
MQNGPTIKPIELRVGVIEWMMPDIARVPASPIGRASGDYRRVLDDKETISGMRRKGDCWDNAVAEKFLAYDQSGAHPRR